MPKHPTSRLSMPAFWVGGVLVALLASTALLGRPEAFPTTSAAGWLPPDGARQRFSGPSGFVAGEWSLDRAMGLVGAGPAPFMAWVGLTTVDWQTAAMARLSTVHSSASGAVTGRSDTLFSVAATGVRTEVEAPSDGPALVYRPGRLDLPGALFRGQRWTSDGDVVQLQGDAQKSHTYHAEYAATAPADAGLATRGCLAVTQRLTIDAQPDATSTRTWCRGEGIASQSDATGTWLATSDPVHADVGDDPGFDWARADQLALTPLALNQIGAGRTFVTPITAPGVLSDGSAVLANTLTSDVMTLDTGSDPPPVVWRTRAGGRNTASATFGELTVVAGSGRHLVAYGASGQWQWQQRLTDLAIVDPVRLGDLVVVATLDGRVAAFDLATGARRWSYAAGTELRVRPVVAEGRLLVADQAGTLTCLDANGVELWSADVGRVERFGVAPVPGGNVVVLPSATGPHVLGLSLVDGSRLWRQRVAVDADDLLALDRVVVLRDADETVGLDPATGERRWLWRGPRTYAATGGRDRLLVLAAGRLLLLDDAGTPLREWPVEVGDLTGAASFLVAAQRRLLVYGPGGLVVGVTG